MSNIFLGKLVVCEFNVIGHLNFFQRFSTIDPYYLSRGFSVGTFRSCEQYCDNAISALFLLLPNAYLHIHFLIMYAKKSKQAHLPHEKELADYQQLKRYVMLENGPS